MQNHHYINLDGWCNKRNAMDETIDVINKKKHDVKNLIFQEQVHQSPTSTAIRIKNCSPIAVKLCIPMTPDFMNRC